MFDSIFGCRDLKWLGSSIQEKTDHNKDPLKSGQEEGKFDCRKATSHVPDNQSLMFKSETSSDQTTSVTEREVSPIDAKAVILMTNRLAASAVGAAIYSYLKSTHLLNPNTILSTALHQLHGALNDAGMGGAAGAKVIGRVQLATNMFFSMAQAMGASTPAGFMSILGLKGVEYLSHKFTQQAIHNVCSNMPMSEFCQSLAEAWLQTLGQAGLASVTPVHSKTADGGDRFSGFGCEATIGEDGMGKVTVDVPEITGRTSTDTGSTVTADSCSNLQIEQGASPYARVTGEQCVAAGKSENFTESADPASTALAVMTPGVPAAQGSSNSLLTQMDQWLRFPAAGAVPVVPPDAPEAEALVMPDGIRYHNMYEYNNFYNLHRWLSFNQSVSLEIRTRDYQGVEWSMFMANSKFSPEQKTFIAELTQTAKDNINLPSVWAGHGRGWAFNRAPSSSVVPFPFRYEVMLTGEDVGRGGKPKIEDNPFLSHYGNPEDSTEIYLYPDPNIISLIQDFQSEMSQMSSDSQGFQTIGNRMQNRLEKLYVSGNSYLLKKISVVDTFNVESDCEQQTLGLYPTSGSLIVVSPFRLTSEQQDYSVVDEPESAWLLSLDDNSQTFRLIYAKHGLVVNEFSRAASYEVATNSMVFQYLHHKEPQFQNPGHPILVWRAENQVESSGATHLPNVHYNDVGAVDRLQHLSKHSKALQGRFAACAKKRVDKLTAADAGAQTAADMLNRLAEIRDYMQQDCPTIIGDRWALEWPSATSMPDDVGAGGQSSTEVSLPLSGSLQDPSEKHSDPVYLEQLVKNLKPHEVDKLIKRLTDINEDLVVNKESLKRDNYGAIGSNMAQYVEAVTSVMDRISLVKVNKMESCLLYKAAEIKGRLKPEESNP